jgi:hypothetical protein
MSTLKVLKEYLVGDGGYLLNDDNNGKTVMLSGAWGSGKTHFWLEDVRPQLEEKKQKNIYISLYGRESIGELKFEVLKEAYNLEVKDDIISKSASMLSTIAPSLGEKSLVDGFDKLNKKAKEKKSEEILKSGSIICLDDFERKSTKIDLNDLFGYISQLALDYNCKVVIILNSDVFEGKEANVFKTVKEKTVNKFFYFEPSIEELFNSIYSSDDKYKKLDDHKDEILNAIKETEELNARIYIQVLDNCLEWIDKGYDLTSFIRALVFNTVCFIRYQFILSFDLKESYGIVGIREKYPKPIIDYYSTVTGGISSVDLALYSISDSLKSWVTKKNINDTFKYAESTHQNYLLWIDEYEYELNGIFKYVYKLKKVSTYFGNNEYSKLLQFIKIGILLKKYKEPSS